MSVQLPDSRPSHGPHEHTSFASVKPSAPTASTLPQDRETVGGAWRNAPQHRAGPRTRFAGSSRRSRSWLQLFAASRAGRRQHFEGAA